MITILHSTRQGVSIIAHRASASSVPRHPSQPGEVPLSSAMGGLHMAALVWAGMCLYVPIFGDRLSHFHLGIVLWVGVCGLASGILAGASGGGVLRVITPSLVFSGGLIVLPILPTVVDLTLHPVTTMDSMSATPDVDGDPQVSAAPSWADSLAIAVWTIVRPLLLPAAVAAGAGAVGALWMRGASPGPESAGAITDGAAGHERPAGDAAETPQGGVRYTPPPKVAPDLPRQSPRGRPQVHRAQSSWMCFGSLAVAGLVAYFAVVPVDRHEPMSPATLRAAADLGWRVDGAPVGLPAATGAWVAFVWLLVGALLTWRTPPPVLQVRWVITLGSLTALLALAAIELQLPAVLAGRLDDASNLRIGRRVGAGMIAALLLATLSSSLTAYWVLQRAALRSEIENGLRPAYPPRPHYRKRTVQLGRLVAIAAMLPAAAAIVLRTGVDGATAVARSASDTPSSAGLGLMRIALLAGGAVCAAVLVSHVRRARATIPGVDGNQSTGQLPHAPPGRGPHERLSRLVLAVLAGNLAFAMAAVLTGHDLAGPSVIADCMQIVPAWWLSWELWDWWPGRPGGRNRLDATPVDVASGRALTMPNERSA